MTFHERLHKLRKSAGMTQKQLADKTGVYQTTIHDYECGRHVPSVFMLCCLADALNCSTDYLMGRSDKKNDS